MTLLEAAAEVRKRAYAPYSGFSVGAAVQGVSGKIYTGCNVENAAYPESLCAEAAALAAMVAAGERKVAAVAVIADSPCPVPPCGGCRQKLAEFADGGTPVTMATTSGSVLTQTLGELLPGRFDAAMLPGR